MADKEALIFVLDLGQTMADHGPGRNESNLDWSMRYVWDKISHIASMNRKTLNVGVLGFRTEDTDNMMQEDASYHNIKTIQPLGPCTLGDLRSLRQIVRPSRQFMGDAISALIIATAMMNEFTRKLKYKRQIVLVTDGRAPMDDGDVSALSKQLRDCGIKLTILGVDFDDANFGFKEENKDGTKQRNERTFRQLAAEADGQYANVGEAIADLDIPVAKPVRPFKTYDGFLSLGTEGNGPSEIAPNNLMIGVERYFRTKTAPSMVSTIVIARSDGENPTDQAQDTEMKDADFEPVKISRTYVVEDPRAPGGKRDVPLEDLAKGYEYGRTAVHINKSDENVTNLETRKSFTILGFIDASKYNVIFNMGESCVTYARSSEPSSVLTLAALTSAMERVGAYAVARFVIKDWKEPQLLLLVPDSQERCFYDVPLPFAEDLRRYQFPPLERIGKSAGVGPAKDQLTPDKQLDDSMSDFVDTMDISQWVVDEDNDPIDYMNFNPMLHRIKLAVQHRGVYSERPIPEIPPNLVQFSQPGTELATKAKGQIRALVQVADAKKVPPKPKGGNRRDAVKPVSGLDVEGMLGNAKKSGISMDNTIPDFMRLLDGASSKSDIEDAVEQMGAIVRSVITDAFGGNTDGRAVEMLGAVRREMISAGHPDVFNDLLKSLKTHLAAGELGGDRRELWFKIVKIARLGLIRSDQCEGSSVTVQEAAEFYNLE
ncbi:uncharacterized protein BROUX77_004714 [Berkeleyomyces rouxiae]|uniref:uncharacterized protein n=1 Tax=Berkeleyomyces rouxiae TaxID=2035830 RepID=UPI003B7B2FC9